MRRGEVGGGEVRGEEGRGDHSLHLHDTSPSSGHQAVRQRWMDAGQETGADSSVLPGPCTESECLISILAIIFIGPIIIRRKEN